MTQQANQNQTPANTPSLTALWDLLEQAQHVKGYTPTPTRKVKHATRRIQRHLLQWSWNLMPSLSMRVTRALASNPSLKPQVLSALAASLVLSAGVAGVVVMTGAASTMHTNTITREGEQRIVPVSAARPQTVASGFGAVLNDEKPTGVTHNSQPSTQPSKVVAGPSTLPSGATDDVWTALLTKGPETPNSAELIPVPAAPSAAATPVAAAPVEAKPTDEGAFFAGSSAAAVTTVTPELVAPATQPGTSIVTSITSGTKADETATADDAAAMIPATEEGSSFVAVEIGGTPSTQPTTLPSGIAEAQKLIGPVFRKEVLVVTESAATKAPSTQPTVTVVAATPAVAHEATPVSVKPAGMILSGTDKDGRVKLLMNQSVIVTTRGPVSRVSVAQPEVADINPLGENSILITAKKMGTTQLIVWDDDNKSQLVDVGVEFDIRALQEQLKRVFPDYPIEAVTVNGAVALRGHVPNLQVAEQATAIATPFTGKVLNLLEIAGGQQVMLQVKFLEMSRIASTELGFSTSYDDGRISGGAINGGNGSPIGGLANHASSTLSSNVTLFGSGRIGNTALEYFISAMKKNNLARTLAEPNLIAISGQEASFLAGGEIPVPVPQTGSGGGSTITIEYKEFGIKLKFVPIVMGDGRIRMKVAPEVSDLDYTNSVSVGGLPVPGIKTRKVDTTIELTEGQTFAIAGLLNRKVNASNAATPGLGEIPILGALFRSVKYERSETELVVLVTPKLVAPMNPGKLPAIPGADWRYPTDGEIMLNADLGGPVIPVTPEKTALAAPTPDATPARPRTEYGLAPQDETPSGDK